MNTKSPVLSRLRRICLSLPEATETNSWGHPNFRAGKRTFVTFEWINGRPSIAFRLDANEVDLYLLNRIEFFATPYGRGKWISIWADGKLDWRFLNDLINKSYRTVALKRMITVLDSM